MSNPDRDEMVVEIHSRLEEIASALQNIERVQVGHEQPLRRLNIVNPTAGVLNGRLGVRICIQSFDPLTITLGEETAQPTNFVEQQQEKEEDIMSDNIALLVAANGGDAAAVEQLLQKGIDVNWTDEDGWTALMCAAAEGHSYIVKLLLNAGADVEIEDDCGNSAASLAEENSHFDIYQILSGHVCPFCYAPPTDSCNHHLASEDAANDYFETYFTFGPEVGDLVRTIEGIDEKNRKRLNKKLPDNVRQLFEWVEARGVCYWINYDGVSESCLESYDAEFSDYFHSDPARFVKEVNEEAERAFLWLRQNVTALKARKKSR